MTNEGEDPLAQYQQHRSTDDMDDHVSRNEITAGHVRLRKTLNCGIKMFVVIFLLSICALIVIEIAKNSEATCSL